MTFDMVILLTVVMILLVLASCVATLVLTYRSYNQNYYEYNKLSPTYTIGKKMKRYVNCSEAKSRIEQYAAASSVGDSDELNHSVRNYVAELMVKDRLTLNSAVEAAKRHYLNAINKAEQEFKETYGMQDDDHVWNL